MKVWIYLCAILLLAGTCSAQNYRYQYQSTNQEDTNNNVSEVTVKVFNHPKFGKILTDSRGMTLYMYTPDQAGESNCYAQCAVTWPPLIASGGKPTLASGVPGKLDTTVRRDNSHQVTYNGMPLYYYIKDKRPGDAYGQNVEDIWFVIKPSQNH